MGWQANYEIAQSLRKLSASLWEQGEHRYASVGIYGALRYADKARSERYSPALGQSFKDGFAPGRPNEIDDIVERRLRWATASRLERHFYSNNLAVAHLMMAREAATELLDEAFAVLES